MVTHEIKVFAPNGDLLIHTWHKGEHSKNMELLAIQSRMKRGEIGRAEVFGKNPVSFKKYYHWSEIGAEGE